MDRSRVKELLTAIRFGEVSVEEALKRLERLPVESLGFAQVDHHRSLRCGFPEVILCPGKTTRQIVRLFDALAEGGGNVLATRAKPKQFHAIVRRHANAEYHELARCVTLRQLPAAESEGVIAIVSAGTSDLPVAEEARVTAEIMDQKTATFYDVGVAGLHRLLRNEAELRRARVVVVVAGMEGALLSVVGGLIEAPVIGVPTSVGYGASFSGLAPLLTMLNSCAAGSAVVNIDNGFGAGYMAAMINRVGSRRTPEAQVQPHRDESVPPAASESRPAAGSEAAAARSGLLPERLVTGGEAGRESHGRPKQVWTPAGPSPRREEPEKRDGKDGRS